MWLIGSPYEYVASAKWNRLFVAKDSRCSDDLPARYKQVAISLYSASSINNVCKLISSCTKMKHGQDWRAQWRGVPRRSA
jgi:hypothetical protein